MKLEHQPLYWRAELSIMARHAADADQWGRAECARAFIRATDPDTGSFKVDRSTRMLADAWRRELVAKPTARKSSVGALRWALGRCGE